MDEITLRPSKFSLETATAPRIMKAIVCSGQSGSVFCPELKLLRIKTAFYGKEKGRDCLGKQTNDTAPTCYARDTIMTVKNMCEGQQSCDIFSDPLLYGHTLCGENVLKYLKVEYTCEGHSDLTKKLTDRNKGKKFYHLDQHRSQTVVKKYAALNKYSSQNMRDRSYFVY